MDAINHADQIVAACLSKQPFAWQRLVDEYAPAVVRAIGELGNSTNRTFDSSDVDQWTRAVFEHVRANDYAMLRGLDQRASLETSLVVVARRIVQQTKPTDE